MYSERWNYTLENVHCTSKATYSSIVQCISLDNADCTHQTFTHCTLYTVYTVQYFESGQHYTMRTFHLIFFLLLQFFPANAFKPLFCPAQNHPNGNTWAFHWNNSPILNWKIFQNIVQSFRRFHQRPKNAGGRVALLPGRFGSIRKIFGHGLLKTSLKNRFKICPDSSRCFRTAQIMSRQPNMCPDRLIFCPDSSKYIRTD